MEYFIALTIVMAVASAFFLLVNTADYMEYRDGIRRYCAYSNKDSNYNCGSDANYNYAKNKVKNARENMRFSALFLILSPLAGIIVPVLAAGAVGYGVWRLIYMMFFEKVEGSE